MPKIEVADKVNPRRRVTFLPLPAINPERMGIIGRTHGVNDSSNPKPRKLAMTSQKLPVLSSHAIRRASAGCRIEPFARRDSASAKDCVGLAEAARAARAIGCWRVTGG